METENKLPLIPFRTLVGADKIKSYLEQGNILCKDTHFDTFYFRGANGKGYMRVSKPSAFKFLKENKTTLSKGETLPSFKGDYQVEVYALAK